MNDIAFTVAAILFLLSWYGVILVGRRLLQAYEKLQLAWCPEIHSFSFIETNKPLKGDVSVLVNQCLLWPEFKGCNQRCVK
jgi:hypothetical protein